MKTVKALCNVDLLIECEGSWSEDTTMQQIVKQAEDTARGQIAAIIRDAGTPDEKMPVKRFPVRGVHVVGILKITAQVMDDRK